MAWCCQVRSFYLTQCWPRSLKHLGVIMAQWVNEAGTGFICRAFSDTILMCFSFNGSDGIKSAACIKWIDKTLWNKPLLLKPHSHEVVAMVAPSARYDCAMSLLPDTQYCELRMRRGCRERFSRHRGLAIPTCITARSRRTCRDACRDR